MQDAEIVERFFTRLAEQRRDDDKSDRYGSAHAVIGLHGEVRQLIPYDEIAYHAGGQTYQSYWMDRYPQYCHNKANSTPNHATIGIELCHPTETGEFNHLTEAAAVGLGLALMGQYTLGWPDNYRHYDITGKVCPRFWVHSEEAWQRFRAKLRAGQEIV